MCFDVEASGISVSRKIAMEMSIIYLVPYILATLVSSEQRPRRKCVCRLNMMMKSSWRCNVCIQIKSEAPRLAITDTPQTRIIARKRQWGFHQGYASYPRSSRTWSLIGFNVLNSRPPGMQPQDSNDKQTQHTTNSIPPSSHLTEHFHTHTQQHNTHSE